MMSRAYAPAFTALQAGARSVGSLNWRAVARAAGLAGLGVAAGIGLSEYKLIALVAAAAVAVLGWALLDRESMERAERALVLMLLGGGLILGYGFANLGLRVGPLPLPATEILFIPLAFLALLLPGSRMHSRIMVPLIAFSAVVLLRLGLDYPRWHILAIRDATIGLEILIVAVGYRSVLRDGIDRSIRRMGLVMTGVLVYGGLLYPWRNVIEAAGPTVGLQRPVPLLDFRGTKYAVIAATLYFLTYARGWRQKLAVGFGVALVGVFQARSLYVLLPLTLIALAWARREKFRMAVRLLPVVAVGATAIFAMAQLSIEGRRGPVEIAFIESHARTLLGEKGPMAGSIEARNDWLRLTVEEVTRSPASIIAGVGLGPDLTFGLLKGKDGEAVRTPHNDYLEVFARLGLLGFVPFVLVVGRCLFAIARKARSGSGQAERFCAWIFASSLVYLGVAGAQALLSFPYGSIPLFFMLGMGAAVAHHDLHAGSTPVEKPVR